MPPKYVLAVMERLRSGGYEAYMVGGCVRDALLGREPNDYDIATDASPEAVTGLFERTIPTGIRHGTVTVSYDGGLCEVTTYRTDGEYSDHRRPDTVRFTRSLTEDLARRDFTINAMAMDAAGRVTDPFGGRRDLGLGLVRCVGDPMERFSEDALRMFRAVRFSAQLGFEIDGGTLAALRLRAPLSRDVSAERVASELGLILASGRPDFVWLTVEYGLLDGYVLPSSPPDVRAALGSLPPGSRWAYFCRDLERGGCIGSAGGFLSALRLDSRTIRTALGALEVMRSGSRDWKRLLRDYGRDAVLAAYPDEPGLKAVLTSGECYTLASLAINGDDLTALGYSGAELGRMLRSALDYVIDHPEDNDRAKLVRMIEEDKI